MRIGVDLMGGDTPPEKLFEAVREAALESPDHFVIYTTESLPSVERVSITLAKDFITMDDSPLEAIKQKTHSSLALGIQDLKNNKIDAFISVGNTGALVASSSLFLEKMVGISRLCLLALLPTRKGVMAVVDVGANIAPKASHLLQYAHLGAAYMQKRFQISNPKIALLNIGEESYKGFPLLKEAHELLKTSSLDFLGNIEGTHAFDGNVDVIVTDGFTGNIFLKASEGTASFIFEAGKLEPRFNYEEYPGALLSGLSQVVVKCHGDSTPKALLSGIRGARDYFNTNLIRELAASVVV